MKPLDHPLCITQLKDPTIVEAFQGGEIVPLAILDADDTETSAALTISTRQ